MEKPRMNIKQLTVIRFRTCFRLSEFCISSKETPEINEMYPGTIGKTQGEINESNPNANAVKMLTLSNEFSSTEILQLQEKYDFISE